MYKLKKYFILSVITAALILSLSGCGNTNKSVNTLDSSESGYSDTDTASETAVPEETEKPQQSEETNGNNAQQAENHKEIEKMIKDAKELIDEGLTDDANMLIRDLLTRNLTEDERSQIEALQSETIKISD